MEKEFWMKAYPLKDKAALKNMVPWACMAALGIGAEEIIIDEAMAGPGKEPKTVFRKPFDKELIIGELTRRTPPGREPLDLYIKFGAFYGGTRVETVLSLKSGMVFVRVENFGTRLEKDIEQIMAVGTDRETAK